MEMYCPECMAPLSSSDGKTAVCRTHGGSYQILFARYAMTSPVSGPVPTSMPVGGSGPLGVAAPMAAIAPTAIAGARCVRHPESPAVALCHNCRAPSCATCDFSFPGDIHLCPTCAANPRPQMSPARRKLIPWSIGLAALSICGVVLTLVIAGISGNRSSAEAIGMIGMLISFCPALVGVALGAASFDKRLKTSGIVWIGIIGNGLVLAIWIILMIIGVMK